MSIDAITPTSTPSPVDYALPYPGILPDNPLYFVKVARDSLVGFLIAEPNKKAEFGLHQADKGLQSAVLLLKKDSTKEKLALASLRRGNAYFADAVVQIKEARKQKYVMNDIIDKLLVSAKKHKEVYKEIQKKNPSIKNEVRELEKKMIEFEKSVESISKQN